MPKSNNNIAVDSGDAHDNMEERLAGARAVPRYTRRLSDKILLAAHHACDQGDQEIAKRLLEVVELLVRRDGNPADADDQKSAERLVAAYTRMWYLRHHDEVDGLADGIP